MAATRLTKGLRDSILYALNKRAFKKEFEELEKIEHQLADDVYNKLYTKKQIKLMQELGNDFFIRRNEICARFHFDLGELYLDDYRTFGEAHKSYYAAVVFDCDDPITLRYQKFKADEEELEMKRQQKYREAETIVNSCKTVKKLVELWPEIEPMLASMNIHVQEERPMLPVKVENLNEIFELPPDVENAEAV